MEAKGCAKPMVWKTARRHFYWAVRARLAKSTALNAIEAASPDSSLEYREQVLEKLVSLDESADNRTQATALEALDLTDAIARLKSDHIASHLAELSSHDRKATMNGLVNFVDGLSDEEKITLRNALQTGTRE
jgi:acetyl-CoA carboxylase/biotin carboxylase 1